MRLIHRAVIHRAVIHRAVIHRAVIHRAVTHRAAALAAAILTAAILTGYLAASNPAAAFNMKQARQAVENLGQWSVMATSCGNPSSAQRIKQSLSNFLTRSTLSQQQRDKLSRTYVYWVKTSTRFFETGATNVRTACPIWVKSGPKGIDKEFTRLKRQLR